MQKDPKIIILADDDIDDQELLKEAFLRTQPDVEVHTFSFGKEVIDYLGSAEKPNLPCLIVLDYNMPDLNGAEVLDILRQDGRFDKIPAVIWSTSNAVLYRELCKKKGAKEYFHKPHRFEEVLQVSQRMLDHCASRD